MTTFNLKKNILSLTIILASCQSTARYLAQENHLKKSEDIIKKSFSGLTCEQLIQASQDTAFALNNLAALRAHKSCKNFKAQIQLLSEFEKLLYSQELAALASLNSNSLVAPVSSSSVTPAQNTEKAKKVKTLLTQLKKDLKKEKEIEQQVVLLKKLRIEFKNEISKNESLEALNKIFNISKKALKTKQDSKFFQENFLEAGLTLAKQFYANDNDKKALELLNNLSRTLKNKANLAEVHFLQAKIEEDADNYTAAVANYELTLKEIQNLSVASVKLTPEKVEWNKAWVNYKAGQYKEALENFTKITNAINLEPAERARSLFFKARTLQKLDQKSEAQKIFKALTQADFFSYYSLMAYQELGLKLPALKNYSTLQKFNYDPELKFLTQQQSRIFKALINYQESELIERFFLIVNLNPEQNTQLGLYLAEQGQKYLPLFAAFAKLTPEQKQDVILKHGALIFPQVHLDEVKKMSDLTQTPVSLIYSIMKQESAFNPQTRSRANAKGLMQVIPPTAKLIAKKFKVPLKNSDDLYDPQINIQIGSYELTEQIKKQKNQYSFVAAAYNAGPAALNRWLKTRWKPHFDVVDFIEEIPFEETRLYVKIVARNFLFYERVTKPDQEIGFPENFIQKNELISQSETQK